MAYRWEYIDGYNGIYIYIDSRDGRICGGVSGSHHNNDYWYAHIENPTRENLGRYVTLDLAKRAVENANNKS